MKYILDTNVVSEYKAKRPNQKVLDWLDGLESDSVFLSVITLGEIRKGIERSADVRRKEELRVWLEKSVLPQFADRILPITTDVMLVWGELAGALENQGKPMSLMDSLIAASALQGNFTLVTRNVADFQHSGVTVINPWDEI